MNRHFPALRGIAILLVIVNHSITLTLQNGQRLGLRAASLGEMVGLSIFRELGTIAVPIFLFISASFLVYAMQGKDWKSSYRVIGSGLKHVLWPYLVWSLLYYLIVYFIAGEVQSPLGYVKSLLVGYPYNFVPLLVAFYLISPLLVVIGRRWPWLLVAAFGLYQLFTIAALKPGLIGITLPEWTYYLTLPVLRVTMAIWGIFFPLGVVFSLHGRTILPILQKIWIPLFVLAFALYIGAIIHSSALASIPQAGLFLPLPVMLLLALLKRDQIPAARNLEKLGKKAYGLYLTNLVVIYLLLAGISVIAPWLAQAYPLTAALVFTVTLLLPYTLMAWTEKQAPTQKAYRYVFG